MKQILLALICTIVCTVSVAGAEDGSIWSIATATRPSDGHRIIYRYRSQFAPSFTRASYPDRVVISWNYATANGMPSVAERQSMDRLEDLLGPYVEQSAVAALVLVTTGEGLREWIFYTTSQKEFMTKLNTALRDEPRFPIDIDLASDPNWTRFDDFRKHKVKE